MRLTEPGNTNPAGTGTPPPLPTQVSTEVPLGPVIGGAVGGAAGLAILALLLWWYYKQLHASKPPSQAPVTENNTQAPPSDIKEPNTQAPNTFITQAPTTVPPPYGPNSQAPNSDEVDLEKGGQTIVVGGGVFKDSKKALKRLVKNG